MSNTKVITVAELLELPAGDKQNATWVNDDFEAVLTDVKPGQKVTTAILSDPHSPNIRIAATFFGRDCSRFDGKLCHFSGKGMTRTEYKGTQQVTIGDKATVQVLGAAPAGAAKSGATVGGSGSIGGSSGIHGATVGMAINQATAAIAKAKGNDFSHAYLNSPAFAADLYATASDIIRVSRALEAGKLAPKAADRNDPDFKKKQEEAAAKAEADRKAAEEAERKRKEEEERAANRAPAGGGSSTDDLGDVPFAPTTI
jgi:hypothetical protein